MTHEEKQIVRTLTADSGKDLKKCTIPERVINDIREKVVFIKINKFYRVCFNREGCIDNEKVKDCASGIWRMGEKKRTILNSLKKNCYVFAIFRCEVLGVFRILRVSDEVGREYCYGLSGFPKFPPDIRDIDLNIARFSSVEDANDELHGPFLQRFLQELQKRRTNNRTSDDAVLDAWRKRVYFELDDTIPEELSQFKGCRITKEGDEKFFKGRNPLRFNF